MKAILGWIGMSLVGWLGWWLGSFVGITTAILLAAVGTGAGLYLARRLGEAYLE